MSRYATVLTTFKDPSALVAALIETGKWTQEKIEIHTEAQHLFGWHGDKRPEKANIIIRRKFVGTNSNDIGFVQNDDGTYRAIISDFDSNRYGQKWLAALKGNYAYHKIKQDQEIKGRRVVRERCSRTGRQRIEISGYR